MSVLELLIKLIMKKHLQMCRLFWVWFLSPFWHRRNKAKQSLDQFQVRIERRWRKKCSEVMVVLVTMLMLMLMLTLAAAKMTAV